MADKRISQLVDRGTVANNDVVPIVVSGATTTNKATISSIQTFMQGNLDLGVTSVGITLGSSGTDVSVSGSPITSSGNITINIPTASATNRGLLSSADWSTFNNKVSSVGLSMPSAFSVANSPITGSGTIAVTGAGTVSQYVRGDGSLADFPQGGGGGSSVNYYLNGSVSQGTIGGIAYQEMNKTPVLGAGTDFVAIADGYLASFITDAGDPALLEIPAGNWNFETYFSASSGGGTPTFYIELYKVNSGGTATLIASNSATPELIAFGTVINPYFSTLAVPTTALAITDRLALRYYVARSGRTITLHTENSHLCQIITTFTTGLAALNGLTAQVQNFATGTSGTDFAISSSVSTHTFNLPTASALNRGALSSADWTTFNNKQPALNGTGFVKISGTSISYDNSTYLTTSSAASTYLPLVGGTLTGNLNGTTASFENGVNLARTSGNVGIGIDAGSEKLEVFSGSSRLVQKFRTSTNGLTTIYASAGATVGFIGNGLGIFSTATETQFGIRSESDLLLGAGGVPRLTLAAAGGATFTNNVTIGQATAATNVKLIFSGVANKAAGIEFHQGGSPQWYIGNGIASEDNNFELFNSNGTMAMKIIKSTNAINFQGAATFSNSVATPFLRVTDSAGQIGEINSTNANGGYITWGTGGTTIADIGTAQQIFGTGGSGNFGINARGSRSLIFGTNNTARFTIDSSGNVGIGTASPLQTLTLAGTQMMYNTAGDGNVNTVIGSITSQVRNYGTGIATSSFASIQFATDPTSWFKGDIRFLTNGSDGTSSVGTERMRITSGGLVDIAGVLIVRGTLPADQTDAAVIDHFSNTMRIFSYGASGVTGDFAFKTAAGGASSNTVATINGSTGIYTPTSDINKKKDFEESTIGLNEILGLKPTLYRMINDESEGEKELGFLAQEVKDFIPYAYVESGEDEEKFIGLNYNPIVAALVKAVQELKTEIDSLKNQMQ